MGWQLRLLGLIARPERYAAPSVEQRAYSLVDTSMKAFPSHSWNMQAHISMKMKDLVLGHTGGDVDVSTASVHEQRRCIAEWAIIRYSLCGTARSGRHPAARQTVGHRSIDQRGRAKET